VNRRNPVNGVGATESGTMILVDQQTSFHRAVSGREYPDGAR
jgi:hypothetical protein